MDGSANSEIPIPQYQISEGGIDDIDSLPKDLGIFEEQAQNAQVDDLITLGPLEFNYDPLKEGLEKGTTRLRMAKDQSGKVVGFTSFSPGEARSDINYVWVDPTERKGGLGVKLLQDALTNLPNGEIDMDIWGKQPMENLARKMGFKQNPGGQMTNRFTLIK